MEAVQTSQSSSQVHDTAARVIPRPLAAVPLLDLDRENGPLRNQLVKAFCRVLESNHFILGDEVESLEGDIAARCETSHAIGCASGSDALLLALMALNVGAGDEVILPSFTFFATASAVTRLNATPVFVDIELATFNFAEDALVSAITPRTKAIIPVHLFGQCAPMPTVNRLAEQHGIAVVEDAAQSIGARISGRPAGSWGDIGCFSFYPTKNLGGCGDGGMLTTSDEVLAGKLRLLRGHGMSPRYYHRCVGINSRLDAIQAALLRAKLEYLNAWTTARRNNARRYTDWFGQSDLPMILPVERPTNEHVWNQYTIRITDGRRDELRRFLADRGIGTEIYYPVPLHLQACFEFLGYQTGSLPATERAAGEVLSLPIFPQLTVEEQTWVVESVVEFFG